MASVVALDASPMTILRSMRGTIVAARVAHPDVLHIELRDGKGRLWRLATQDAEWSPSDTETLLGKSVADALIDEHTGVLDLALSDGSRLEVKPGPRETSDDPPNWELITPNGLILEFGPGLRWQIGDVDTRARPAPDFE